MKKSVQISKKASLRSGYWNLDGPKGLRYTQCSETQTMAV